MGSEPPSDQLDRDIHWLARALQCILVSEIRYQPVTSPVVTPTPTPFYINGVLVTSPVLTPMPTRGFYINRVWC